MSVYGNVPAEAIDALRGAVRIASTAVTRLPALSPPGWRESAYELVLSGILEDWVENGTTDLDEDDEDDLGSLIRLSADLGLSAEEGLRDVTFHTVLRNAMSDWVENWNAEDDE